MSKANQSGTFDLSSDERHRAAIDYMTERIKSHAEKNGKEMTDSAARKQATDLAHLVIRKDAERK